MTQTAPWKPQPVPAWFPRSKFGLFIHWGLYALLERGEQSLYREHLTPSAYRTLADRFKPARFDPDAWARTAKAGGMRYALFTTKHHDGFCLWDSPGTPFNAARTGLNRDYVRDYVRAFRRAGIKVGLYFSTADWSIPAYFEGPARNPAGFRDFIRTTHEQVRELCTQYGKIDLFWFDGVWPHSAADWRAKELVSMIRALQPGIIINDRVGLPGDITTPEQGFPEQQFKPSTPWECCMTSTEKWWGWHRGVAWKSDRAVIRTLSQITELGGNLVFNVGPKPDGSFPAEFTRLMKNVGGWLDKNGEAIYGVSQTLCDTTTFGLMTCKPGRVFLHVLYWPGAELHLAGLKNKVRAARFLVSGKPIPFRQESEGHLHLSGLPGRPPDPRNTVIELTVTGTPQSYDWARDRIWTGALDKTRERARAIAARRADWSRT